MADYEVKITFNDGSGDYILPYVQSETGSNAADEKSVIIEGTRGDGSIYIPGGKKSKRIVIKGVILGDYKEITDLMNDMKTKITTDTATLIMKHKEGVSWVNDWSYVVRRIGEIQFPETFRTDKQEYQINCIIIAY